MRNLQFYVPGKTLMVTYILLYLMAVAMNILSGMKSNTSLDYLKELK